MELLKGLLGTVVSTLDPELQDPQALDKMLASESKELA